MPLQAARASRRRRQSTGGDASPALAAPPSTVGPPARLRAAADVSDTDTLQGRSALQDRAPHKCTRSQAVDLMSPNGRLPPQKVSMHDPPVEVSGRLRH